MDLNELKTLDFQTIGLASLGTRMVIFLFVIVLIVGAVIYFDTLPQRDELAQKQRQEASLLGTIETKQKLAANLKAYQDQLKEMQTRFGELLRQLPNKSEAENLIIDVAQTSLKNGLKNKQIQPGREIKHNFYAEMPYTLTLEGTYNQLAKFISDTANLPRIVTLHNPTIKPEKGDSPDMKSPPLVMTIVTKTYRYLEQGEGEGK
ncbi:type 4a pilus biogenesis protein PilO [Halothiobacillus sp.]|jgi:type IV pilus assembly protein PilO|uniref:type 4a pilus biogenesis protein PilO n=1 Tax=Halothiobacillus sp. TaxID=1891311 RepID=UPI002621044D|nr:type 4a pilus biogenesis protein PilO [Halothiobacillus sp.]MDD4965679.1 type 4a pilus biogenesis protein PilO [Halothiobacillus sp.]MDY0147239.1 type 4a pilus biogenesis protein PilO [Halothiobacillus sp.]